MAADTHPLVQALSLPTSEVVSPTSGTMPSSKDLIQASVARVWRSLRYLGVADQDLADASQEVFLVVHRRLPEFRGDSTFETWLFGICVGVARNAVRRKQTQRRRFSALKEDDDVPRESTIEARIDLERARDRLRSALDQLSAEQREVFVLHEIEELDMRAVARTLRCPLFTAYSRLRRARQALSRILEGEPR